MRSPKDLPPPSSDRLGSYGDGRADGTTSNRGPIRNLAPAVHVVEIKAQRCQAALGQACGYGGHECVAHACPGTMSQH
jgi:hypothetical protein